MYCDIGRLTKDIELKDAGKTKVANFDIAVPRARKVEGQPETDFVRCVAFGATAETMAKYLKKGQQVYVTGDLMNNPWTDKDGHKRDGWHVAVNGFKFVGNKADGGDAASAASDDEVEFPTF